MRGVPVIRISRYRKLFDRSTLIHAMFFLVKLVCYCEMAMRLMLPYVMPFPIGRTLRLTLSHLIRLYERVLRTVLWYAVPVKLKAKSLRRSPEGPYLSSSPLRYVSCSASKPVNQCRFDTDSSIIGVDSHATVTMSNNPDHFENLQMWDEASTCRGFTDSEGAGAVISGDGIFVFDIEDDNGMVHTIKLPNSLYIPAMTSGPLLSPQHWSQVDLKNGGNKYGTGYAGHDDGLVLHWGNNQYHRHVSLNPNTNTPSFHTAPGSKNYRSFAAGCLACEAIRSPVESTIRISPNIQHQRENDDEYIGDELLLPVLESQRHNNNNNNEEAELDHPDTVVTETTESNEASTQAIHHPRDSQCPLHPSADHLWKDCSEFRERSLVTEGALTFDPNAALDQDLPPEPEAADPKSELLRWHYRLGHLSFEKIKALAKQGDIPRHLAKIKPPVCPGCLFGAMTRVPKTRAGTKSPIFTATRPGEHVSVDQLVSTQVGFVAQLKGKLTIKRYKAATVFVDHYSRLRYVHMMYDSSSEETIKAKRAFERWSLEAGIRIRHYHCDNGRFADNAFIDHCAINGQRISYCGVNAHHQNGIAERAIRDIQDQARKQLLHAKAKWPAAVDLALWPYALRYAAYVHNMVPVRDGSESCMTKFTGVRVELKMRSMHSLFCPVFALQNELAAGNKLPKWSPRARIGMNLGQSPTHARNICLILNLETGLVSPQAHIKYDDFFETVQDAHVGATVSEWKVAAGFVKHDGMPSHLASPTSANTDVDATSLRQLPPLMRDVICPDEPDVYGNIPVSQDEGALDEGVNPPIVMPDESNVSVPQEQSVSFQHVPQPAAVEEVFDPDDNNVELQQGFFRTVEQPTVSSRGRSRMPSRRLQESSQLRSFHGAKGYYDNAASNVASAATTSINYEQAHDDHLELQERMRHPIAFHAEMMGDIMYYHQAMRQNDADKFTDAVIKEVNGHVDMGNWNLIKRNEVPDPEFILPSVWAMRRKRNLTTNEITKYKARLNIHGGKQTYGVNYFDTYAPVVTWFAIRLIIIFAVSLKYCLKQVDFVMAFPQAPIENDMYMELPAGIRTKHGNSKDYVLQIVANLYGQKQGGRVWNQYLVDKLKSLGFDQSLVDECVFYRGTTIFILYVDDGIVLDLDERKLVTFVKELQDVGLNVEDQGHPSDYIGVNIKKDSQGRYNFTQSGLIDSIIEDVGLSNVNAIRTTPAKSSTVLHAYPDSPKFDESQFGYRSAVGKLNYLAQTTRPDIMTATHMIAKYSHDPRKEHGLAIIHLVMYLKGTRHIGLRFSPDRSKGFENYVDADFSGLWNKEFAKTDPSTAKSRSGWVVFYAGCPIIWSSKLQGMVALSTTEAEYIALSQSLRDVLPMMELVEEIKARGFNVLCTEPYVYCKSFEDNSGALELARLPKLRPRSKHINTCYHHFREHVRKGLVKIFPIDTKLQTADVLTKNLPQNDFVRHRISICGQ